MTEPKTNEKRSKGTLRKRFQHALLLLYLLSLVAAIPLVYGFAAKQIRTEAERELTLLVDMVKSVREYVAQDVRPGLLAQEVMHSPAVSSTVAVGMVAKHFRKKQPDYYIKVVSDNPLNPANAPQPLETRLLQRFRTDRSLKAPVVESGDLHGRKYWMSARPSVVEESCLHCHGDPYEAPTAITDAYGTDSGFFWKQGDVVGVSVVGVPMGNAEDIALGLGLVVAGGLTLFFVLVFVIVSLLLQRTILTPVARMTEMATQVSKGKIDAEFPVQRDGSEIGELGSAFEMLRRSLVAAMERLQARRDP